MLRIKHRVISSRDDYFDDGQYVATYDGGPCTLLFANGKEYEFSLWSEELIENRIYPEGEANIACIIDFNYETVSDRASADRIDHDGRGEVTYYKEGKTTIVAHAETPIDSNSKWVIVCNKKKYDVIYSTKYWSTLAQISENGKLIGSNSTTGLFFSQTRSRFIKDIPLSERVFISLLAGPWFQK